MSNDIPLEKTIRIISTEKITPPISKVVCREEIAILLSGMEARLKAGYHDMIVLFGPSNQTGDKRYVQDAALVLNESKHSPVFNANKAALNALNEYKADGHPEAVILGIGASASTDEQIANGLQLFPLYCSASIFKPDRWGITGVSLDKLYFFALDRNKRPTIIPPSNVVFRAGTL